MRIFGMDEQKGKVMITSSKLWPTQWVKTDEKVSFFYFLFSYN